MKELTAMWTRKLQAAVDSTKQAETRWNALEPKARQRLLHMGNVLFSYSAWSELTQPERRKVENAFLVADQIRRVK